MHAMGTSFENSPSEEQTDHILISWGAVPRGATSKAIKWGGGAGRISSACVPSFLISKMQKSVLPLSGSAYKADMS